LPIHQEVIVQSTPEAVFEVLTSAKKFAEMTGGRSAEISAEPGGAFKLFGGDIEGRNIELIPGARVVQAWRPTAWPKGLYSLVRFELTREGGGTKIVFDQIGHPEQAEIMLTTGWQGMYWDPIIKVLGL
jgi:uncharacterized protein YndB with AHSA1/START domain